MAKTATKSAASAHTEINIGQIHPRPGNGRKAFSKEKLKELTNSLAETGVLEPLLVRPRAEGGYELIDGWRRWTVAPKAKLDKVPCFVREMTDEEAAYASAVANLHREDLDPIDEAMEFSALLAAGASLKEVSKRLAKDPKHIARRAALAGLIEEGVEDLRAGHISIGHALEIARLPEDAQPGALQACYGRTWRGNEQVKDKTDLELTVDELKHWIERNLLLKLDRAPFKLDDARLREDGLTCVACPQRTGHNKTLFADLGAESDHCLNRECFAGKATAFVQLEAKRIAPKGSETPAPIISNQYGAAPEGMLSQYDFALMSRGVTRCDEAERAVWGAGPEFGKTAYICRSAECSTHGKRFGSSSNGSSSNGSGGSGALEASSKTAQSANRRQEIFDIKVNEATRLKVFKEAIATYKHPLPRDLRNRFAAEFFRRLPFPVQHTVEDVLEWGEGAVVAEKIEAMEDREFGAFLMLCSFAHFGANQGGYNRASQREVVALAEERKINYALLDAETRAELSPKKYAKEHQAFLDAIRNGISLVPPNVYGGSALAGFASANDGDDPFEEEEEEEDEDDWADDPDADEDEDE